jgi:hypothetical protein
MHAKLRTLVPYGILVVTWLGVIWYAYPGFLAFDSVWQLSEARSHVYSDWHPPAMAALWHYVDAVLPGPLGMLGIQVTCFIAGAYLVLCRMVRPLSAAIGTLALTWFPPVGATLAVVWKDAQMLGYLMLGAALILGERRSHRIVGLVVLLLAALVRHNAFLYVGALVIPLFVWSAELTRLRRYALATGITIAIIVTSSLVNRALTDKPMHPWHGSLAMFDIVGTMRFSDASEEELRAALVGVPMPNLDNLRENATRAYNPRKGVFTILHEDFIRQPKTEAERDAISHAWWTLVTSYPAAYLRHRRSAYSAVLGLRHKVPQAFWVGIDRTFRTDVSDDPGPARDQVREWVVEIGRSWLVRPIVYLVVVLLLFPLAVIRRDRLMIALGVSAIVSELSLFVIAPTADFRYSIWLVIVAFYLLVFAATRLRPRRA